MLIGLLIMDNERKKDLIIGMLHALISSFRKDLNEDQEETYLAVSSMINDIYYLERGEKTNDK